MSKNIDLIEGRLKHFHSQKRSAVPSWAIAAAPRRLQVWVSEQQQAEQLLLLAVAVQQVWSWEVHLPCSTLPLLILANSGFFVKPVRQRMTNIGQLPQILREENTLLKKKRKRGKFKMLRQHIPQ